MFRLESAFIHTERQVPHPASRFAGRSAPLMFATSHSQRTLLGLSIGVAQVAVALFRQISIESMRDENSITVRLDVVIAYTDTIKT